MTVTAPLAILFVVIVPLLEELIKPLGVMLTSYRRPSPAQVFLWGLANGAGFALVENVFNTLFALNVWGVVMVMRVGATMMHCLGSSLVALGWQNMLTTRRPWNFFCMYGLSVTLHAAWNATAVGVVSVSLLLMNASQSWALTLGGTTVLLLLLFLVILSIVITAAFGAITFRLQRAESSKPDSEPAT